MKQINGQTWLGEEETARRLGIGVDELFTLVLEGGRPSHIFEDGEHIYVEADVARMRSEVHA